MFCNDQYPSAAAVARGVRVLPDALARALANEKPGSLRVTVLNALYNRMSPADQLRCKAEVHHIREARRAILRPSDAFGHRDGAAEISDANVIAFPPPVTGLVNA